MTAPRHLADFARQTAIASAIMSASQFVEIGLTNRAPSDLPVRVVERLLRHRARTGVQREVANQLVQGALAASALIAARLMRNVPAPLAIPLNAVLMSLGNAAVVRMIDLDVMPWKWSWRDLGTDLTHKTSLSLATRALVEQQSVI